MHMMYFTDITGEIITACESYTSFLLTVNHSVKFEIGLTNDEEKSGEVKRKSQCYCEMTLTVTIYYYIMWNVQCYIILNNVI